MSISMNDAMRSGLVSAKAASKPAILKQTRVQNSKMADFDSKRKAEGSLSNKGALKVRGELDSKTHQTPNHMSKGGRVNASYAPGPKHIDGFPEGHAKTFPRGAAIAGGPSKKTGNTRMKGPIPRSGGPYGGGGKGTQ